MGILKFKTVFWDKSKFLRFIETDSDFSHFIFQPSNKLIEDNNSENASRRIYRLIVYAYDNSGGPMPIDNFALKPAKFFTFDPPLNPKPPLIIYKDKDIHFGNIKMPIDILKLLIPNNDDYQYLRFDPVPEDSATNPNYVGYIIYPVKKDGKTVGENDVMGILTRVPVASKRLDPSPPAP